MKVSYLKEFRRALKLSQKELAEKAGLSIHTIQRYEKEGFSDNTPADKFYYYCRALGIPLDVIGHFNNLQKEEMANE